MFNKCILIGRLTADPELKKAGETSVTNFTLAVDRPFKNNKGEKETDFVRIVVFGKQAENVSEYLKKGRLATVEGRLQIRSYEDKEGAKKYVSEIIANNVIFMPDGKNGTPNIEIEEVEDDYVPF